MTTPIRITKTDKSLGLVFGYAVISAIDGEPYFDLAGDHIPESVALEAFAEFMASDARDAKVMHVGPSRGRIIFAWPLSAELNTAMGISSRQTGVMIAAKFDDPAVLQNYESGRWTGFSVGGRGEIEEIEQ